MADRVRWRTQPGMASHVFAALAGRDAGPPPGELDTNAYSVPWLLIGERVRVSDTQMRIHHGAAEVAVHPWNRGSPGCGGSAHAAPIAIQSRS